MTTAHLIISTEYRANMPSVFLLKDGSYYGCQIYPSHRNFPTNVNYWHTATGSDDGRFFKVKEVEVSEADFELIEKLQLVITANETMITERSWPYIVEKWKRKRGKVYEQWKAEHDAQQVEFDKEYAANEPFKNARRIAFMQLRNLLLSLKK